MYAVYIINICYGETVLYMPLILSTRPTDIENWSTLSSLYITPEPLPYIILFSIKFNFVLAAQLLMFFELSVRFLEDVSVLELSPLATVTLFHC